MGWHTTTTFHNGNLDEPCDWFLIGYEKWCHNRQGHAYLAEAYHQEPSPSTSRPDADLTPVGQRYVAYSDHGHTLATWGSHWKGKWLAVGWQYLD